MATDDPLHGDMLHGDRSGALTVPRDPRLVESLGEWAALRRELGAARLGFVPTMGALHSGHARLIERSVRENERTLVSIFVNPTQFNNPEDLKHYPRTLLRDVKLLKDCGADFVLLPRFEELYADAYRFQVVETQSSETTLCGRSRPGHFRGVLTVVLKLLNVARAERAYFGEKDYQQLELIRSMAAAFFLPTEVVGVPTARAESGLALSSRNERLSASGLAKAARFPQLLRQRGPATQTEARLRAEGFEVDYVDDSNGRRYGAVVLEGVRLIDNFATGELE